jgi:hypothetical protein
MPDKTEFTRKLTAQSDIWTAEDAIDHWWQSRHGGWRLTHDGFRAFEQYGLEHWDFETPVAIQATAGILLALDRKLTAPYYIKIGKKPLLCFFDSKEATMYALYNDVTKFLSYLKKM